jgi:hypothetical protein
MSGSSMAMAKIPQEAERRGRNRGEWDNPIGVVSDGCIRGHRRSFASVGGDAGNPDTTDGQGARAGG